MESTLAQLARKERSRLRLAVVDVDEHPELAARFEVREVPTLVLVVAGTAVARIEGRASSTRIDAMLEAHRNGSQVVA